MTLAEEKIYIAIKEVAHPSIRADLRKHVAELVHLYDIAYREGARSMRKAAATTAFNTALKYSLDDASPLLTAERCAEAVEDIEV